MLRANAIDPEGPHPRITKGTYYPRWSDRLGTLYAQVIVGSVGSTLGNVVHETDPAEARSPYATAVRRKLDESNDTVLLASTGRYLVVNLGNAAEDPDRLRLGRRYAERALQLDPQSRIASQAVQFIDALERSRQALRQPSPFAGVPRESWPEVVARMPVEERLPRLASLASEEYGHASAMEYVRNSPDKKKEYTRAAEDLAKDPGGIRAARERSKRYAQQALELAATLPNHPSYGDVIYDANLTLSLNAFWDGDRQTSVRYMLAAARAPKPDTRDERRFPGVLEGRLTVGLLKAGERDSVAEYLERSSEGREADQRDRMLKEAAAIRAGRMPERYQWLLANSSVN